MTNEQENRFQGGFEIVSAIAGRLRLRALDKEAKAQLETVAQRARQQNGVSEVRTNQKTGSLIIAFEPNRLGEQQLLEILKQCGIEQMLSEQESQAALKTGALKQASTRLQSLIPALAGIFITRTLGFYGWSAIPAYLISAEAIRFILDQINCGLPEVSESEKPQKQTQQLEKMNYRIVHRIPGRIRLMISQISQDQELAGRLQRLAVSDRGIKEIRINRASASVVIAYEIGRISESEILSRLNQLNETIEKTGEAKNTISSITEENIETSPQINEEVEEIEGVELSGSQDPEANAPTEDKQEFTTQETPTKIKYWSCFRASALTAMLNLMCKLPIGQAQA